MSEATRHNDGVYFGLPESEYHNDDALGSTDIKNLIMGPEVYWANTRMNPLYEPKDTKSTARGSAYHKLILEGQEAFDAAYAVAPEPADYPNALHTMEELRDRLKALDLPVSGRKSELIERLLEADPKAQVWDVIKEQFADENPDREYITNTLHKEIVYASRFIFSNPHLANAFSGGFPEVSIFHTVDGVRRKARVDYLKVGVAVDLKSYSNVYGSRADVAIHTACARDGHDLQAAWYRPLLQAAKELPWIRFGKDTPGGDWEQGFRHGPEVQSYFIYQAVKGVPMARAKWMHYELQTFKIAAMQCENAVETFKQCREEFGEEPWIVPERPSAFEDEGYPMFRR